MKTTNESVRLTPREKVVLIAIANGFSNREIGEQLSISHRTVDTHRTNIRNKLGVSGLAGMIKYAIQSGLVN